MTKEELIEKHKVDDWRRAVENAFLDGKSIEYYNKNGGEWFDSIKPLFNWVDYNYRVKEEPKYIPFDFSDDLIGMQIIEKITQVRFLIVKQAIEGVGIDKTLVGYNGLLENYTRFDGFPVGKLATT